MLSWGLYIFFFLTKWSWLKDKDIICVQMQHTCIRLTFSSFLKQIQQILSSQLVVSWLHHFPTGTWGQDTFWSPSPFFWTDLKYIIFILFCIFLCMTGFWILQKRGRGTKGYPIHMYLCIFQINEREKKTLSIIHGKCCNYY